MGKSPILRTFVLVFVGPLTATVSSCGEGDDSEELPAEEWMLDQTPLFSVGGEPSGPTSDLFQVVGALRLEDGRIVIAERTRLIVLDDTGSFLETWGGAGSGPGEFENIQWVQRLEEDSLLIFDNRRRQTSTLTSTGDYVRSTPLNRSPTVFSFFLGRTSDGSLVSRRSENPVRRPPLPAGVTSGEFSLWRHETDGSGEEFLGAVRSGEQLVIPGMLVAFEFPLRMTQFAVGQDAVYAADGVRFEIVAFELGGDSVRSFGRAHEPLPLTPALFLQVAGPFGELGITESDIPSLPDDQTLPAISDLLVDDIGNIWAEEYDVDRDRPRSWSVFDREGAWIAIAELPARFKPFHIGGDFVLGVIRDELEVERVELYPLSKPGS